MECFLIKEERILKSSKNNYFKNLWPRWRWLLVVSNLLALILSAILSWHFVEGGKIIGCSGGNSCEQVLNSKWSMIGGLIPISGLALGAYLAIFVASFIIGPEIERSIRKLAWSTILILSGSILGSAIWFTILQKWIIGKFCYNCMTTHIIGLILVTIVTKSVLHQYDQKQKEANGVSSKSTIRLIPTATAIRLILFGLFLTGIMIILQVSFDATATYSDGKSKNDIPIIDYNTSPILGSPKASHIVTVLFDYQCPHCQKLHFMLDEVTRRYNGKLAFALCPTPLNTQCNTFISKDVEAFKNSCELAKIGLTVWFANHEMFSTFENWMFSFDTGSKWQPRSLESTKEKAIELIGKEDFDKSWTDPKVEKYMQTSIQIFGKTIQNGKGGIPKLIYGSYWVIPEPTDTESLISILQKTLRVPKPN